MSERTSDGRFKKGVSGNPAGRGHKAKDMSQTFLGVMNKKVHVTEGGKRRRVTKGEAIAAQITNQGASGDLKAGKLALDFGLKAEEKLAASPPSSSELNARDQIIVEGIFARWRAIHEKAPARGPDDAG